MAIVHVTKFNSSFERYLITKCITRRFLLIIINISEIMQEVYLWSNHNIPFILNVLESIIFTKRGRKEKNSKSLIFHFNSGQHSVN